MWLLLAFKKSLFFCKLKCYSGIFIWVINLLVKAKFILLSLLEGLYDLFYVVFIEETTILKDTIG